MKKLFVIVVVLSFFAFNTDAQVTRKVNPSQKTQSDSSYKRKEGQMMKDLNLSQAQKSQMKELHQSMMQQRNAIKNDASLSQEQKKAKMQELHKTQQEKMNSILTPEQKEKWQADKKMGQYKSGGMMKDLNLTDAQKAQMKANSENMQQQMSAIKNDASLSQEQKKAKLQELHKAQQEKMNSILTPEQREKWKSEKKEWQGKNKGKKWNDKKQKGTTTMPGEKSANN